jgi:hypothetical protein
MIGLLFISSTLLAVPMPPIPTEPIYFEPPIVEVTEQIRQQSCVQIDNNIRYLQPYKYSYKPDFYQDDANKVAAAMVTMESLPVVGTLPVVGEWLGFIYLGYSAFVDEKEERRILDVKQQIAMLQQVKAEKHCFE